MNFMHIIKGQKINIMVNYRMVNLVQRRDKSESYNRLPLGKFTRWCKNSELIF